MGRSNSKLPTPTSPLQELQLEEIRREQFKRQQEKKLKKAQKIREKQKRKQPIQIENQRKAKIDEVQQLNPNHRSPVSKEEHELHVRKKLQNQLSSDLCSFVLNQISLTWQFFGNFESEISTANEIILENENSFTQLLEEHSIILPNSLDAAIAKRIQFKPKHGPEKNFSRPLQSQTMFVVFENIDVARPGEANYDSISAICKVDMETDFYKANRCNQDFVQFMKDVKWKGYVRLKLRNNKNSTQHNMNEENQCESGSKTKIVSAEKALFMESDYGYITYLNTPQPLEELRKESNGNEEQSLGVENQLFPTSCISDLANYINEDDDDDDEKGVEMLEDEIFLEQYLKQPKILYLNSEEFMRYFSKLLQQKLVPMLGLSTEELENATFCGESIYTKNYEIIPAIHVTHNAQNWPECMFQFRLRERPICFNPVTGQQIQWPTKAMIKRIESFGFHVVPVGFAPKKTKNPYRNLEWKIVLPKAERYLESHLTNAQIKVFMIAKALVKTFVDPQETNNAFMLTTNYLRTHLFWECERNFSIWPEEFLGEVLLRFLKSFMSCLREKRLPDFFIQERNLLECIPEYSLIRIYATIGEIVSNPLMHVMAAFRNLDIVDDFIPKIDFKKVFLNLIENDYLKLTSFSKSTGRHNFNSMVEKAANSSLYLSSSSVSNADNEASQGLIMSKKLEQTKGPFRRRTLIMKRNIEEQQKMEYERNRNSVDSIDVEYFFNNDNDNERQENLNIGVENLRRTNILEIVIDNLIAASRKAIEQRSISLATIYIIQAKRLCIFYSNYGCDMNAKEYMTTIESIDHEIRETNQPPALPHRSCFDPIKLPEQVKNSKGSTGKDIQSQSQDNLSFSSRTLSNDFSERRRSIKFKEDVIQVESKFKTDAQIHGYNPVYTDHMKVTSLTDLSLESSLFVSKNDSLASKKFSNLTKSLHEIPNSIQNQYSIGKTPEGKPAKNQDLLRKIKIDLDGGPNQTTIV